jgi:hypothetical protein
MATEGDLLAACWDSTSITHPSSKSSAAAMPTGGHVVAGYQGGVGIGPAGMVGRGK